MLRIIRFLSLSHVPVMVPHQLDLALFDVVSLAPEIHGILCSIPLSEYSQLSNFLIRLISVCLLFVAIKEYPLCAVQIPPQRPTKTSNQMLSIFET